MAKGTENKRDAFVRLAEARTNKIIDMVKLLGNLSSKSSYDYSAADVKKIFSAIRKELESSEKRFSGKNDSEVGFKL